MDFEDWFQRAKPLREVFPDLCRMFPNARDQAWTLELLLGPTSKYPSAQARASAFHDLLRIQTTFDRGKTRAVNALKRTTIKQMAAANERDGKWLYGDQLDADGMQNLWRYVHQLRQKGLSFQQLEAVTGMKNCRRKYNNWLHMNDPAVCSRAEEFFSSILSVEDESVDAGRSLGEKSQSGEAAHVERLIINHQICDRVSAGIKKSKTKTDAKKKKHMKSAKEAKTAEKKTAVNQVGTTRACREIVRCKTSKEKNKGIFDMERERRRSILQKNKNVAEVSSERMPKRERDKEVKHQSKKRKMY